MKKLIITCPMEHGFWRGGMHFPHGDTILDPKSLSREQLAAIKAEPRLKHRPMTDEDETPGDDPGDSVRYHRFRVKATDESIELAGQTIYKSKWQVFMGADVEPVTEEQLALVEQLAKDGAILVEIYDGSGYRPIGEGEGLKA